MNLNNKRNKNKNICIFKIWAFVTQREDENSLYTDLFSNQTITFTELDYLRII